MVILDTCITKSDKHPIMNFYSVMGIRCSYIPLLQHYNINILIFIFQLFLRDSVSVTRGRSNVVIHIETIHSNKRIYYVICLSLFPSINKVLVFDHP